MTEHAKRKQPDKGTSAANGVGQGYGFLVEANQRAFARWFHGLAALSEEITQFTQSRLQEDMAAWSTLANCKSAEDAFQCQQRFAEKATAQYADEATKLSQLMMTLATEGLSSFKPRDDTSAQS